ncbi:type II secretion system protein D [Abditibacteriota bacterium]|nr:type II secretion system protein D [Abditibacteriota bacterium]
MRVPSNAFIMKSTFFAALWLLATLSGVAHAQGRAYTTIKSIIATPLSNGVQISVLADGILQYRDDDMSGRQMGATFPDARNGTGKNFINLNRYPVSHLQMLTPQGAQNGIGLRLNIFNLSSTTGSITRTPDGQGVLLTIQSDRTLPTVRGGGNAGASEAATTVAPDEGAGVSFKDGLISIRAVRADIHELMGAIARESGLAVAVDDAVDRKVSLNLQDVTPESAVRTIGTAYGLALAPINGILMLSEGVPSDLATYRASSTQSFRIQNSQADAVSGLLPNFLSQYVKTNAEQNAIVVTAPAQILTKIGADLGRVDVPSPQIAIEAIAVELSDTSDLDIGLRFGNPNPGQFAAVDVGSGSLSYNTIGALPRSFEANLKALELKGRARVRARPQMVVVNGATANLFIGSQRFILTQFNQSGQTQNRIQPVDVGVKLSVTPLTGGNGEITARVAPEVSNITELDLQSGLPVLSTRRSETTVRIKDGETIAIGGLTLDQEQTRRGKIPFLGDLPLFGPLFRSRKNTTVKTELVVFVTPHIVKPGN